MADYTDSTYGERIAAIYDKLHELRPQAEAAAEFLAPLAKGRRILELGIGTGRGRRVGLAVAAVCGLTGISVAVI